MSPASMGMHRRAAEDRHWKEVCKGANQKASEQQRVILSLPM